MTEPDPRKRLIQEKSQRIYADLSHRMVYKSKEDAPAWYFKRRSDFGCKGKKKNKSSELRKRMVANFEFVGMKFHCIYCGGLSGCSSDRLMTVEHLMPKNILGSCRKENLAPSCKACNEDKGCLTHFEYVQSKGIDDPLVVDRNLFIAMFHRDQNKDRGNFQSPDPNIYCL